EIKRIFELVRGKSNNDTLAAYYAQTLPEVLEIYFEKQNVKRQDELAKIIDFNIVKKYRAAFSLTNEEGFKNLEKEILETITEDEQKAFSEHLKHINGLDKIQKAEQKQNKENNVKKYQSG